MRREEAIRALAALLTEAELQAERDSLDRNADGRDLDELFADQLIRKAPAYGLSIRADDGSEVPTA